MKNLEKELLKPSPFEQQIERQIISRPKKRKPKRGKYRKVSRAS